MASSFIEWGECPGLSYDANKNAQFIFSQADVIPVKFFMFMYHGIGALEQTKNVKISGNQKEALRNFIEDMIEDPMRIDFWKADMALVTPQKVILFNLPSDWEWIAPKIQKTGATLSKVRHLNVNAIDPLIATVDDLALSVEESKTIISKFMPYFTPLGWKSRVTGIGMKDYKTDLQYNLDKTILIGEWPGIYVEFTSKDKVKPKFMLTDSAEEMRLKRITDKVAEKYRNFASATGLDHAWMYIRYNDYVKDLLAHSKVV